MYEGETRAVQAKSGFEPHRDRLASPDHAPEVIASVRNLEREIENASELLGALFARLTPITRADVPRAEKESGQAVEAIEKCRVSSDIDSAALRIRLMQRNIGSVMERLGL